MSQPPDRWLDGRIVMRQENLARFDLERIDLHWLMYPSDRPCFVETNSRISQAIPADLGSHTILAMPPEDVLIHLATQLANDKYATTLLRAADISTLITRGLNWDRVMARAEKMNSMKHLTFALTVGEAMGAILPPDIARRTGSSAWQRFLFKAATCPEWLMNRDCRLCSDARLTLAMAVEGAWPRVRKSSVERYRNRRSEHGPTRSAISAARRCSEIVVEEIYCGLVSLPTLTYRSLTSPGPLPR